MIFPSEEKTISVTTRLTESDLIRFNFYIAYRKLSTIFILGIALLMIFSYFAFPLTNKADTPWFLMVFTFFALVGFPVVIYFSAQKSFRSNRRLHEEMTYIFSSENIRVTGSSFSSVFDLEKIYKLSETRNYIFIWQTKQSANLIPKRDLSAGQLADLRQFIKVYS